MPSDVGRMVFIIPIVRSGVRLNHPSHRSRRKSGKDIERTICSTHLEATRLGFQGSPAEWEKILRTPMPLRRDVL